MLCRRNAPRLRRCADAGGPTVLAIGTGTAVAQTESTVSAAIIAPATTSVLIPPGATRISHADEKTTMPKTATADLSCTLTFPRVAGSRAGSQVREIREILT